MFSQKSASAQRMMSLLQTPRRGFQQYGGAYKSGFERMLADKMTATRAPGHWFALFGIANLALYGVSMFASEANFDYHFGYKGDGRFFQPFRSMLASERLLNVACTAPALKAGRTMLQRPPRALHVLVVCGGLLVTQQGRPRGVHLHVAVTHVQAAGAACAKT